MAAAVAASGCSKRGGSKPGLAEGKFYYRTGELRGESFSRPNGFFLNRLYYKNGQLYTEYEAQRYVDMVNEQWLERGHGLFRRFYDNGQLYIEGRLVDDKRDGPFKVFYRGGQPQAELNYQKDEFEGLNRWFFPDGKVAVEVEYKNDAKNGLSRFYYENGVRGLEMRFTDDREQGNAVIDDAEGKCLFKLSFKDGTIDWAEQYDPSNGQILVPKTPEDIERMGSQIVEKILWFFEHYDKIQQEVDTPPDFLPDA